MRNVSIAHHLPVLLLAGFVPLTLAWGQDESGDPPVTAEKSAAETASVAASEPDADGGNESTLLSKTRQLTFEGRRAGEGYFSADGSRMVFQSERDAANPFYQIYVTDLETGDIEKVSPGHGKTTCAWIHPTGKRVLFASTQDDLKQEKNRRRRLNCERAGSSVGTRGIMTNSMNFMRKNCPMARISV